MARIVKWPAYAIDGPLSLTKMPHTPEWAICSKKKGTTLICFAFQLRKREYEPRSTNQFMLTEGAHLQVRSNKLNVRSF